ncbi:YkvI family membrane protein [Bacillus sp. JJ1562]|uniref:YkvI family membrane protein n=1 Tax=Bacillus sp. JJ1562 TaxID=3122960 RepID=UPI0030020E27
MRGSWGAAFQIGAVYVGTIVGAGFATGREIVEFFTQYGMYGLIGIGISGFLFIWLGTRIMIIANRIQADSYKEFNEYLFGRKIGFIVNALMLLVLIGVTSVMLSGAGAVFHEQLGLSYQLGIVVTSALSIFVLTYGVKGLFGVNMFVVPIMIFFSVVLAVEVIITDASSLLRTPDIESQSFKWMISPFLYAAFNLAMAMPVLVPLAKEMDNEKALRWGGLIGGGALCLILITSHISLSALPNVESFEIPMAEVMKNFMSAFFWLYILVIYGEIFTSVIGNLFGLERQLINIIKLPSILIVFIILSIAYVISQLGYGSLISFLYPLFGYMSLILLVLLARPMKRLPKK